MKRHNIMVILAVSGVAGLGIADEVTLSSQGEEPRFSVSGRYFIHYGYTSLFPLTENGATLHDTTYPDGFKDGLEHVLDHRLRLKAVYRPLKSLSINFSGDVAGQIAGDTTNVGKDYVLAPRDKLSFYNRSILRELFVQWRLPFGMLRVGQMQSMWGLGLLANSGDDPVPDFYDKRFGDLVERIMFVSKLGGRFYLAVAGDLVFRDENAVLWDKDIAGQGVLSFFHKGNVKGNELFAGTYLVYRHQKFDNDDRLRAFVADIYAKYTWAFGEPKSTLSLEGEALLVYGDLRFAQGGGPPRAKNGTDILQWASVGRVTSHIPKAKVKLSLDLGALSGDNDPTDGTATAFRADPDYQVGMILFQEVLGRMTALAPERVSDPSLVFKPPSGYKTFATSGSMTNAFFIYPVVHFLPIDGLDLALAFLWARALAPVASPYNSAENGGYPLGFRVQKDAWGNKKWDGKNLGFEINGSVGYTLKLPKSLALSFAVQGGYFRAQDAFDDAYGKSLGNVYKIRGLFDFIW
jgi:hypothetical protein